MSFDYRHNHAPCTTGGCTPCPAALDDCILDVSVMGKPELADAFVFAPKPKEVIHER